MLNLLSNFFLHKMIYIFFQIYDYFLYNDLRNMNMLSQNIVIFNPPIEHKGRKIMLDADRSIHLKDTEKLFSRRIKYYLNIEF